MINLTSKMNFSGQICHVKWFSGQKVEYRGELKLDQAQNQAEPENQAEVVPGPDPDKIKNLNHEQDKLHLSREK